jgi:hypothetical protein
MSYHSILPNSFGVQHRSLEEVRRDPSHIASEEETREKKKERINDGKVGKTR